LIARAGQVRSIEAKHHSASRNCLNRPSAIVKQSINARDRIGYHIATGLGAGFVPIAPGTAGAAEGVAVFLAIHALHLEQTSSLFVLAILNVVVFASGVWASNCACRIVGLKDPRLVVIDEVSGQLIALTPLALMQSFSATAVVIGFLLFRIFDIFKPYPIRKLELLHGGLGVMADDALAGVYAAALVWLGHLLHLI
jgi:phosphatidylglycerophosphatase A